REGEDKRLQIVALRIAGGTRREREHGALEEGEDGVGGPVVPEAEAAVVHQRAEGQADLLVDTGQLRNVHALRLAEDVRRDDRRVRARVARVAGRAGGRAAVDRRGEEERLTVGRVAARAGHARGRVVEERPVGVRLEADGGEEGGQLRHLGGRGGYG